MSQPSKTSSPTANRPIRCLLITTSQGERYVLPYGHFLACALLKKPDSDEFFIEVTFAVHTVIVEGRRLETLLDAIGHLELRAITPNAEEDQARAFIRAVEVIDRRKDEVG